MSRKRNTASAPAAGDDGDDDDEVTVLSQLCSRTGCNNVTSPAERRSCCASDLLESGYVNPAAAAVDGEEQHYCSLNCLYTAFVDEHGLECTATQGIRERIIARHRVTPHLVQEDEKAVVALTVRRDSVSAAGLDSATPMQ